MRVASGHDKILSVLVMKAGRKAWARFKMSGGPTRIRLAKSGFEDGLASKLSTIWLPRDYSSFMRGSTIFVKEILISN